MRKELNNDYLDAEKYPGSNLQLPLELKRHYAMLLTLLARKMNPMKKSIHLKGHHRKGEKMKLEAFKNNPIGRLFLPQDSKTKQAFPMHLLPSDLLKLIFSHLSANDLLCCSLVEKKWAALTQDNQLWRHFLRRDFGIVKEANNPCKKLYQEQMVIKNHLNKGIFKEEKFCDDHRKIFGMTFYQEKRISIGWDCMGSHSPGSLSIVDSNQDIAFPNTDPSSFDIKDGYVYFIKDPYASSLNSLFKVNLNDYSDCKHLGNLGGGNFSFKVIADNAIAAINTDGYPLNFFSYDGDFRAFTQIGSYEFFWRDMLNCTVFQDKLFIGLEHGIKKNKMVVGGIISWDIKTQKFDPEIFQEVWKGKEQQTAHQVDSGDLLSVTGVGQVLSDHHGFIQLEHDHGKLYSGSLDGRIKIWNVESKQCEKVICRTTGIFNYFLFYREMKKIFLGLSGQIIEMWNLETGKKELERSIEGGRYFQIYLFPPMVQFYKKRVEGLCIHQGKLYVLLDYKAVVFDFTVSTI